MITRIEVDGFKSLRRFALDLDPFCALIGPNGAGKSNVLDALSLLSRIVLGDLKTAFHGPRGRVREQLSAVEELPNGHDSGTIGRCEFAVEALVQDGDAPHGGSPQLATTRLRYELAIELQVLQPGLTDRLLVTRERLVTLERGRDAWIDRHPIFAALARYTDLVEVLSYQGGVLSLRDPVTTLPEHRADVAHPAQAAAVGDPRCWAESPHLRAFAEELRRIRVVHLDPHRLREPSDRAAPAMTADGAHLATALASLSPGSLAHVRAALAGLVPGTRTVDVVPEGDLLRVEVEATDGRRFASRVLSDGTLRVLGLATMLEASPPGGLIAIEEPENGIHPSRLRALVELLRAVASPSLEDGGAASSPRQVLITSHSPVVLAALMDRPDDIVVVDMIRQGIEPRRSRARRIAGPGDVDRGRHTVSAAEIERLLGSTRLHGEGASEP
ncbi:AAA family ATPase [Sorangium sp. So ce1335]|uniref:AAA family ATPase n=1 Tax=Sorangium sp. So ce1335 TaxID=3133335 RepID=UPI003F63F36C